MIVYTINLVIITISTYISRVFKNKRLSNIMLGIAVLSTILVAGLRKGVGTDYYAYEHWFNFNLNNKIRINDSSIGFTILIKLLQIFTENPQSIFFVSAIIIYMLIVKFVKNNTEYYDMGYFLFFGLYLFYSSLNIMRQWIAISIFLYSLKYLYESRYIKYILMIALASTFHSTALLMAPLILIHKFRINIKNIFFTLVISFVFAIFFNRIMVKVLPLIPFIDNNKYISYFHSHYAETGGGGWAYSIVLFGVMLLMVIFRNKYLKVIKNGNYHFILMIFATVFSLFAPLSMIFSRVQLYFMPIVLVTLPNVVKIQKPKERVLLSIIILVLGTMYMYRSLLINGGEPLPYNSILSLI